MVERPTPRGIALTPHNIWQAGAWPGRAACPIRAVVFHVQDGTQAGSITWANNPVSLASAHVYIDRDGGDVLVVDPEGPHAPYANGILDAADTNLPAALDDLLDHAPNANWVTLSLELAGRPFDPWFPSDAQLATAARWAAWACDRWGFAPSWETFTRHRQYSVRMRPNCPGPRFDMGAMIARAAILLEGGTPMPTDDELLEAAWRERSMTLGEKRFAGTLNRSWGGKALFCARGVIVVNDGAVQDVTERVLDDAATYATIDGSLVRL